MRKLLFSTLTISTFFLSQTALSAPVLTEWGSQAAAGITEFAPVVMTGEETIAPQQVGASAFYYEDGWDGIFKASSSVSLQGDLPSLKAYAYSDDYITASAASMGSQGFTYTGNIGKELELNISFHSSIIKFDDWGNTLAGSAVWINSEGASFETTQDWANDGSLDSIMHLANYGNNQDPYLWQDKADKSNSMSSYLFNTDGDATLFDTLSFWVNPGDTFYVVGALHAFAQYGEANAENTTSMYFTDDADLTAASSQLVVDVPVTGSLALFLLGTGLLFNRRKV